MKSNGERMGEWSRPGRHLLAETTMREKNEERIHRALSASRWFQDLPRDTTKKLVELSRLTQYRRGEMIHRKGEYAAQLYGIVSGSVRVSALAASGREIVLFYMGPGSWFGHIGLLDGLTRTHDVEACQASEVISISRAEFQRLLDEKPILYKHFALLLCEMVRSAFSMIEEEALLSGEARLAKCLLSLANRCGSPRDGGTLIELHLPQHELGLLVNASRQRINRKLVQWQEHGWIEMHYGKVKIVDRDALQRICEHAD